MTQASTTTIPSPFTVVVDTREQLSFPFASIRADADQHRQPIAVQVERRALNAGDYSIVGHERRITIERKSLHDLYNTLGQSRARFTRELERLMQYEWAAVVCEADWPTVLAGPPPHSMLNPKTVYRSVITWMVRYPKIHWVMCSGREMAEITTYRILERWWKEHGRSNPGASEVTAPPIPSPSPTPSPIKLPNIINTFVGDALAHCESILEKLDDIPDRGQDFAESVREKVESIQAWVEEHGDATQAQLDALQNMEDGVDRWIR